MTYRQNRIKEISRTAYKYTIDRLRTLGRLSKKKKKKVVRPSLLLESLHAFPFFHAKAMIHSRVNGKLASIIL